MLCQIRTFRINIISEITKRAQITGAKMWGKHHETLQITTDSHKRMLAAAWTFSACQSHTWVIEGVNVDGQGKKKTVSNNVTVKVIL